VWQTLGRSTPRLDGPPTHTTPTNKLLPKHFFLQRYISEVKDHPWKREKGKAQPRGRKSILKKTEVGGG